MRAQSIQRPILVVILLALTLLAVLVSVSIWNDVTEDRYLDLESTASIVNRYNELALQQRELALVSVGRRMLDVKGENTQERRLQIGRNALDIYEDYLAFGLARPDGSMITFTSSEDRDPPNLMDSELTRRSFEHARSGTRISIGEPYYFPQVDDWILPVRVPLFEGDSLRALNTSAIRYKSINDNLEDFGFDPLYTIHAVNTAFNTTQIYYPLEVAKYEELLRKDAGIYEKLSTISNVNGYERLDGYNSFAGCDIIGVRVRSQDFSRSFFVIVDSSVLLETFWDRSIVVFLAYLLLCVLSVFALNFLYKKDQQYKDRLEMYSKQLEQDVEDRTKELETRNLELRTSNKDLNEALENLKKAQYRLLQAEKMAALGVLAAGVGHEINNPLNFIQGGISALKEVLEKDKTNDKDIETYLRVIEEGVRRCTAITESLGHYSRQGGEMNEDCDIHSVLENCLLILQSKISEGIEIKKDYVAKGASVRGNEGKLHQVCLNILTNAVQAIGKKGTVEIKSKMEGDQLIIAIKDNGHGIKKEDLDRVSDPFFTTKAPGEGTGLGLSIAYSIIEEHGGVISFTSTYGKGTEFVINLPLLKKESK